LSGSGKKFDSIDALVNDLKRNYDGTEVGNRFNDKYRVTTIDSETGLFIWEKLKGFLNKRDVKIIFLVVEEIDG